MTEAEWLKSEIPHNMLVLLRTTFSNRKLLLFACACCERINHFLPFVNEHQLIDCAERYADDPSWRHNFRILEKKLFEYNLEHYTDHPDVSAENETLNVFSWLFQWDVDPWESASNVSDLTPDALSCAVGFSVRDDELTFQSNLLRDIFGNPFRPVAFSPSWRTEHTVGLASQMYETRNFTAMSFLADALEEAGCDNTDILLHCRGDGPHVRGCWVVDLVLEKA